MQFCHRILTRLHVFADTSAAAAAAANQQFDTVSTMLSSV
jgi:hypothetical protein